MKTVVIVVALLLASACRTPSSVDPLTVPLKYKTMASPAEIPSLLSCAAVSRVDVEDVRDDKAIGKRFVQDRPGAVAPVTASTDVAAWVKEGLETTLQKSGAPIGAKGSVLHVAFGDVCGLQVSGKTAASNMNVSHHGFALTSFRFRSAQNRRAIVIRPSQPNLSLSPVLL